MPDLIIVRGVPGSGKTTFANECASVFNDADVPSVVVSADDWMVDGDGKYSYNHMQLPYCHTMCQREVCRKMTQGTEVIFVANTFVHKWEAEVYLQLARLWGYTVTVYRMTGEYENVHGVPADKVAIMKANMEPYSNEVYK